MTACAEVRSPKGPYRLMVYKTFNPGPGYLHQQGYESYVYKKGQLINRKNFMVSDSAKLLSDSHLFVADITTVEPPVSGISSLPVTQRQKDPVAVLVFRTPKDLYPYQVVVYVPSERSGAPFQWGTEHYEFKAEPDGLNEQILIQDELGMTHTWETKSARHAATSTSSINGQRMAKKSKKIGVFVGDSSPDSCIFVETPPTQDEIDALQQKLEARLQDPALEPVDRIIFHQTLSRIYADKAYHNYFVPDVETRGGDKNVLGDMARAHDQAAVSLRGSCPFEEPSGSVSFPQMFFTAATNDGEAGKTGYAVRCFVREPHGEVRAISPPCLNQGDYGAMLSKALTPYGMPSNDDKLGFLNGNFSPSGLYYVETQHMEVVGPGNELGSLKCVSIQSGAQTILKVPDFGWPHLEGWSKAHDLCFFSVCQSNVSPVELWQFDPARNQFKKIAHCDKRFWISPDEDWIIWFDPPNKEYAEETCANIYAYSLVKGVNYRLIHGPEPKMFIPWQ